MEMEQQSVHQVSDSVVRDVQTAPPVSLRQWGEGVKRWYESMVAAFQRTVDEGSLYEFNSFDAGYTAGMSDALASRAEWRPIATRPMDGTRYLAICGTGLVRLVRQASPDDRLPIGDEPGGAWPDLPTGWMPLPSATSGLMESGQTGTDGSQKPNDADAIRSAKAGSIYGGDPAEPRDDSDRSYSKPIGYVAANELSRLHSGHDANLRSAKFGPSPLDGDIPVYIDAPKPDRVQVLVDRYHAEVAAGTQTVPRMARRGT